MNPSPSQQWVQGKEPAISCEMPMTCGPRLAYRLSPASSPFSLKDIWHGARGFFAGREALSRFEVEVRDFFQADHVWLLSTARAGMTLALKAFQKMAPTRRKVIIPGYTCWVVPAAVVRAGLEPVACDNAPYSFDYDYACLESVLAPDVLCVVAQHMFGVPADMDRLRSVVQGRGIFVLEDAAQAMGGRANGRLLGTMGDVGLFSLGRGKNVSTVSGGILTTSNSEIGAQIAAERLAVKDCPALQEVTIFLEALAMTCFLHPRWFWFPAVLPWLKLGETPFDNDFPIRSLGRVQGGLARQWVGRLERFCQNRRMHAQYLLSQVPKLRQVCPLAFEDGGNGPRLPFFVADAQARNAILREGAQQGLGLSLTFPDAVDGIPYFQDSPWRGSLPEAQRLARETVTLPIHPFVSQEDIQRIVTLLKTYL